MTRIFSSVVVAMTASVLGMGLMGDTGAIAAIAYRDNLKPATQSQNLIAQASREVNLLTGKQFWQLAGRYRFTQENIQATPFGPATCLVKAYERGNIAPSVKICAFEVISSGIRNVGPTEQTIHKFDIIFTLDSNGSVPAGDRNDVLTLLSHYTQIAYQLNEAELDKVGRLFLHGVELAGKHEGNVGNASDLGYAVSNEFYTDFAPMKIEVSGVYSRGGALTGFILSSTYWP